MPLPTSFATLKSEIARWLRRSDLDDDIETFIGLTEAHLSQVLRVRRMLTRATATVGAEYATVPGDYAGAYSIKLTDTNEPLILVEPETIDIYYGYGAIGRPCHFAVVGGEFRYGPAPDTDYAVELLYYARIPALSDANPTNWLLAAHPQLYLYGALTQSAPFLKADERLNVWASLFANALAAVRGAEAGERGSGRLLASP